MRRRPRLRSARLACALLITSSCGSADRPTEGGGGEDPRTLAEICAKYCQNAETHGCPDIFGTSCRPSCENFTIMGNADCQRLFKNHEGCLADVPNVCDARVRDDFCLDAYCAMRHGCNLADPRCP
jgi:hypothetical protein